MVSPSLRAFVSSLCLRTETLAVLKVAKTSRCPHSAWQDRIAPLMPATPSPVLIAVGANKGYPLVGFFRRHAAAEGLDSRAWHAALQQAPLEKESDLCGPCRDCDALPPRAGGGAHARAYALELLPSNVALMRHVARHFNLSARVFHFAVAGPNATDYLGVDPNQAGFEVGAAMLQSDSGWTRRTVRVPSVTVDVFMRKQEISHAHYVAVDAEGWDALVIEGMGEALEHKRVDILTFEYHGLGFWNDDPAENFGQGRTLAATLRRLRAFGYVCFWQGENDTLPPASPPCWRADFEFRGWSNLVCTHRVDYARALANGRDVPHAHARTQTRAHAQLRTHEASRHARLASG